MCVSVCGQILMFHHSYVSFLCETRHTSQAPPTRTAKKAKGTDDGVMKMQARYTDPLKTVRSPLSMTPYSSVFTVSTTPYHCV